MTILASTGDQVASFITALIGVYTILIIAYIFTSMYFSVGGRIPYSRWSRAVLDFLRDVCEPYLGLFRRVLPQFGPFDLSPMVGILVLVVVGDVVVQLIPR